MNSPSSLFNLLLHGLDTVECAYYLIPKSSSHLDFVGLAVERDSMKQAKIKSGREIQLGSESFLLSSHGTGSGYPFLIQNEAFIIQFGEFNRPNFFVKFRSIALWHYGAAQLHQRFLAWADSVGMMPSQPERLSRVDFAFDYNLPQIDFDEDHFVSVAASDNQYRKNRKVQTFTFGSGEVVLRVYDKTAEITEASDKTWFYPLWGQDKNVWRIEWQIRKEPLRKIGITTFESLLERQADLLRPFVAAHTSLRIPNQDSNRSRWPLHPLWHDLITQVNQMQGLGLVRELDNKSLLDERLYRIGISVYGYVKRVAAIDALYTGVDKVYMDESLQHLCNVISEIHDPLTWQNDVNKRITKMRLGEW